MPLNIAICMNYLFYDHRFLNTHFQLMEYVELFFSSGISDIKVSSQASVLFVSLGEKSFVQFCRQNTFISLSFETKKNYFLELATYF